MALVRWTPMGNLQSFQHEMNRMFNQFFQGSNGEEAGGQHLEAVGRHLRN